MQWPACSTRSRMQVSLKHGPLSCVTELYMHFDTTQAGAACAPINRSWIYLAQMFCSFVTRRGQLVGGEAESAAFPWQCKSVILCHRQSAYDVHRPIASRRGSSTGAWLRRACLSAPLCIGTSEACGSRQRPFGGRCIACAGALLCTGVAGSTAHGAPAGESVRPADTLLSAFAWLCNERWNARCLVAFAAARSAPLHAHSLMLGPDRAAPGVRARLRAAVRAQS